MKVRRDKSFSMRASIIFMDMVNSISKSLGISRSQTVEFLCVSRSMMFTSDEDLIEEYKKFK